MNPLSRPEGDSSPEKGSFGGRKEVKKMENKKARMKRAQRKALVNCEGNRSFTAAYRDCPLPEGQQTDLSSFPECGTPALKDWRYSTDMCRLAAAREDPDLKSEGS